MFYIYKNKRRDTYTFATERYITGIYLTIYKNQEVL